MIEEEISEWSKLPIALQNQFFDYAEKLSKECAEKIKKQLNKIKSLSKTLKFKNIIGDFPSDFKVACVDGSFLPTSERMGVRASVFTAGYMIFEGIKRYDENYMSNFYVENQVGDPQLSRVIVGLLCTELERKAALECLKKEDVDLILIDGSFYGFRGQVEHVIQEGVMIGERSGQELVKSIRDKTTELVKSRKCIAIMKRVRLASIDGWLLRNYGKEKCVNQNDKIILSILMNPGTIFSYDAIFGENCTWLDCIHYSRFKRLHDRYEAAGKEISLEELFKKAISLVRSAFKKSLKCKPADLPEIKRFFIKCCAAPPFCFEVLKGSNIEQISSYFLGVYNPATGLPFPLDLIDENVSLPDGFVREFLNEVEARLLRNGLVDENALVNWFLSVNPQKEE